MAEVRVRRYARRSGSYKQRRPTEKLLQIGDKVRVIGFGMLENARFNNLTGIVKGYQGIQFGEETFRVEFPDGRSKTFFASWLKKLQ